MSIDRQPVLLPKFSHENFSSRPTTRPYDNSPPTHSSSDAHGFRIFVFSN